MNKCEVGLVKISISVYPIELLVRKSKKIDNAGSGGIFASVDYENGIVQSDAIDFRGNHYNFHPDTNAQIVGFRLPEWQRAPST